MDEPIVSDLPDLIDLPGWTLAELRDYDDPELLAATERAIDWAVNTDPTDRCHC